MTAIVVIASCSSSSGSGDLTPKSLGRCRGAAAAIDFGRSLGHEPNAEAIAEVTACGPVFAAASAWCLDHPDKPDDWRCKEP